MNLIVAQFSVPVMTLHFEIFSCCKGGWQSVHVKLVFF